MKPASLFSGGLVGGCCPDPNQPNPADLGMSEESPQGLAARIKKSEAEAKARREAVRYLGTVDCRWWPDAKTVLIASLREDQNECVRLEAALALARGCCCNKQTIEALAQVLSEKPTDKHPPECSDRVKAAAWFALQVCLSHCLPPEDTEEKEAPERPEDRKSVV